MAELHVFKIGDSDWYIGRDPQHVTDLFRANAGFEPEPEEIEAWDDGRPLTIRDFEENGQDVKMSCGEWAERMPAGFLCSTEC